MKKKSLRFLCVLLCCVLLSAAALSAAAFCLDPQNVYRWNTAGVRYFHPIYSAAGALAHYDYDTLILGSSMVQNWDAQTLAKLLHCRPLKVTAGALKPSEQMYLLKQALRVGKAQRIILSLDLHRITAAESVQADAGRFPAYMFSPRGLAQFQYLLGFSTWLEYIPTDILLTAAAHLPISDALRDKINETTDINRMCVWDESDCMDESRWTYFLQNGDDHFNEGDTIDLLPGADKRMQQILDACAEAADSGVQVTLVLPPCSMLYWCLKTPRQREAMLSMREQLAQFVEEDPRLTLLDLQCMEQTTDLTYYVDSAHAGEALRKQTEQALSGDAYAADLQTVRFHNRQIRQNVEELLQKYAPSENTPGKFQKTT